MLRGRIVKTMSHYDLIVVGGGPAGLTAAIYARRAGKTVLVLEKESFGGQIATSPKVENYPGFSEISGAELAERLYDQAYALGAQIELEEVLGVENGPVKTVSTDYSSYTCEAIILATGLKHRKLGLDGEDRISGISFCAVCDGAFNQGKDVAVCGGGNTALQDALFLSELCRRVTVIHRRNEFRGDDILVKQLKERQNVTILLSTSITGLREENGVLTGLELWDTNSGNGTFLKTDALFEAVGQLPEQTLSASLVRLDRDGFIEAKEDCLTSAPGIFAAGDCRSKALRQLTTACADGAAAAFAACQYLQRA